MYRFIAMFTVALLLFVSSTAVAEKSEHANEKAKNIALLQAALDADISLYTLERLDSSTQLELVLFHEYRLDRVVCETSQQDQERWNSSQKNMMLTRYKQIKTYWLNHPRNQAFVPDIEKISTFLPEYDPETAACADRVLSSL